jgi:hypothetical protein
MVRPLIKSHLKMGGMKLWRKLLRNTFKGLQVLNNSVDVASVICIPPVHVVLLQRHQDRNDRDLSEPSDDQLLHQTLAWEEKGLSPAKYTF